MKDKIMHCSKEIDVLMNHLNSIPNDYELTRMVVKRVIMDKQEELNGLLKEELEC